MLIVPAQSIPAVGGKAAPAASALFEDSTGAQHKATRADAVALGFSIVIGGIYFGWPIILKKQIGIVLGGYFVVVVGYFCLTMCIAEIASFFPFGGGSFGYARCIISPMVGFLIGIGEVLEYVLLVVAGARAFTDFCSTTFETSSALEPVYWVVFFAVSLFTQICGGALLWNTMRGLALSTAVVLLVYICTVAPHADAAKYLAESGDVSETQGMVGFMQVFPMMTWIFVGVEALLLSAEEMDQPTKMVPQASIACWAVLVALSTPVLLVSMSAFPGSLMLSDEASVLAPAISHVWAWSRAASTVVSLPAAFATGYGFLYAAGKLIASMASSKVFPAFLGTVYGPNRTPIAGLLVASAAAFAILFVLQAAGPEFATMLFDACLMISYFVYGCLSLCYYTCASRYSNLQRQFSSPLGLAGAIISAVVFAVAFVGMAFFQEDHNVPLIIFVVFMVLSALCYWLVVRHYEFFSDAEVNTFMKAYVINANLRRKEAIKRKSRKRLAGLRSHSRALSMSKKASSAVVPLPQMARERAMDVDEHASGAGTVSEVPLSEVPLSEVALVGETHAAEAGLAVSTHAAHLTLALPTVGRSAT